MNSTQIQRYMLMCRDIAQTSSCERRSIGAAFVIPGGDAFLGANSPAMRCVTCTRAAGMECAAVHAEVAALRCAQWNVSLPKTRMFVWAEVPCMACLSYIYHATRGRCKQIDCLAVAQYASIYPRVLDNLVNIHERFELANRLGITIVTHDLHTLLGE